MGHGAPDGYERADHPDASDDEDDDEDDMDASFPEPLYGGQPNLAVSAATAVARGREAASVTETDKQPEAFSATFWRGNSVFESLVREHQRLTTGATGRHDTLDALFGITATKQLLPEGHVGAQQKTRHYVHEIASSTAETPSVVWVGDEQGRATCAHRFESAAHVARALGSIKKLTQTGKTLSLDSACPDCCNAAIVAENTPVPVETAAVVPPTGKPQ